MLLVQTKCEAGRKKTPQGTAVVAASNRQVQGGGSSISAGFPVMPGMHTDKTKNLRVGIIGSRTS